MPRSVLPDCRPTQTNATADFLKRFTDRERQQRTANQPKPFSAAEHAALRNQLKNVHFIKPKYSDETEINIAVVCRKWKRFVASNPEPIFLLTDLQNNRYCKEQNFGEWQAALETVTRETMMSFFLRVSEWSIGKIKSWGTPQVYIRQFQQLYTNATGRYMDRNDVKELYKFLHTVLIPRFGYRAPNINGKPVLGADNLLAILTFNIAYDDGIFPSERQRPQLAGCYQLLCYTGARPAEIVHAERKKPKDGCTDEIFKLKGVKSINYECGKDVENVDEDDQPPQDEDSLLLDRLLLQETAGRGRPKALCYEDILMMIVRHPVTGRAVPAMAIKFIHHKGADNKPKPTVFFFTPARKLIFCAVSTIIALALHDQAFDAASLTDATQVLKTKIRGPVQSTAIRWKPSMLKVPVFRRFNGATLAMDEAMTYAKLRDDMGRQSLDAGFERAWTPRFARRGAANAANGNASDAVRDQMMRHDPKFATFHGAYLNENVEFDLQNTFLEEETEEQMYKVFAHVSLTRDPRATRDMVPKDVWENLSPDPEILELEEQRRKLKCGYYRVQGTENEAEIRRLTEKIRTKVDRRDKNVVKEYREYYFYNRPTWDIERQANGEEEKYAEPEINLQIPERARLAQILCHQPADCTHDELMELWIEAIDLMVALCDKRETVRQTRIRSHPQPKPPIEEETPQANRFPLLLDPNQCPDCVGDERLPLEERTFKYCRPTVRNDHFDNQHLVERERAVQRGDLIRCNHPQCQHDPNFPTLDAFRRHVQTSHGVSLRTSDQVMQRRSKKVKRRQMARGMEAQIEGRA
ncbi:FluG domain-containing protein [Colletotrichum godetiae]|uniref:FluG domain-containing protein n=1 Tax=Colletotrichum godetiae TaxID=1209918 RepID=A0AAJ0EM52_9PEZI|nr:FluG domain-containing protein [Colletotrichum godetiae]KAK1657061.1 FluG domain-containing protein [Colletotrichum godetiae]